MNTKSKTIVMLHNFF